MIEADLYIHDGPVRPGYVDYLVVTRPFSEEAIQARRAHPELYLYADNVEEVLDCLLARLDRIREKLAALEGGAVNFPYGEIRVPASYRKWAPYYKRSVREC